MQRVVLASVAMLLLAMSFGCASTIIRGVIRDKPTGNPLPSASVAVGAFATTTNAYGAYELKIEEDVRPSSVLLINAPGYFMYSASVSKHHGEDDELVRDVELVPRTEITPRR